MSQGLELGCELGMMIVWCVQDMRDCVSGFEGEYGFIIGLTLTVRLLAITSLALLCLCRQGSESSKISEDIILVSQVH